MFPLNNNSLKSYSKQIQNKSSLIAENLHARWQKIMPCFVVDFLTPINKLYIILNALKSKRSLDQAKLANCNQILSSFFIILI